MPDNGRVPARYVRAAAMAARRADLAGAEGGLRVEDWVALLDHYAPGGVCPACGKRAPLALDHVVPLSMGGTNWPDNIQPLCRRCNSTKIAAATDYRPDGGAYAHALTERRRAMGDWKHVVFIGTIWRRREEERGQTIEYKTIRARTGLDDSAIRMLKFGEGIQPTRDLIRVLCDCFYCQPADIVYTPGQIPEPTPSP